MASPHPLHRPYEQQINEFKRLGRNPRSAGSAFRVVKGQPRGPLAARFLAGEFLDGDFAFRAHVAGHGDYELGHQAQDGVFGRVDGGRDVQTATIQNRERAFGHVEPKPFAVDVDGRVVDLHGVEDATFLVDFEEAEDELVDLDSAVEGAREAWGGEAADGFGFDGVDVRVVALLGRPVDFHERHFGEAFVRGEFAHEVGVPLVEEDAAFVDGEEGARGFDFFQHDVAVVGDVHDGEVAVFGVADRDAFGRLRPEPVVAVVEVQGVFHHTLFGDFRELFAKVDLVFVRADGHLKGGALDVTFEYEHVGQVNLQLAVGFGEDLVRVVHVVLVGCETVADEDGEGILISSTGAAALLAKIGDCVGEPDGDNGVQRPNVDPELQRIRGNDTHQFTVEHFLLDLSSVLRRVSSTITHDSRRQVLSFKGGCFVPDRCDQDFALFSYPTECNDSDTSQDQLTEQPCRLGHGVPSTR